MLDKKRKDAGNFSLWHINFIEKEISYYRDTYTSIETRAGFFSTFASGLAALLVLLARTGFFENEAAVTEKVLFVCILFLLVIVILCSVAALRPRAGKSKLFGVLFWQRDIVQFYRGANQLTKKMQAISQQKDVGANDKINLLEEAWLIAEPEARYVHYHEIDDDDFQEKFISARLVLLNSFRAHVQVKAFFVVLSIYFMMLATILFFCLITIAFLM